MGISVCWQDKKVCTVGDLRKALAVFPDDLEVVLFDVTLDGDVNPFVGQVWQDHDVLYISHDAWLENCRLGRKAQVRFQASGAGDPIPVDLNGRRLDGGP